MFKKVMIANRGAIAVRIERTLKKMGITSVAVYSQADQDSLHIANADEAYFLGDGKVSETYLNIPLILKIAKENGVEAIHRGYGFLSENADFARECAKNGIVFIGPTPDRTFRTQAFCTRNCTESKCSNDVGNSTSFKH